MQDVALRPTAGKASTWEVVKVRLSQRSPLRRRRSYRVVDWDEVASLFAPTSEAAAEAARLRDMHPSDVAHLVLNLPLQQRRQLAEAMEDDRLADVLEELSEAEQLRLIEDLDLDRLVSVLEEMEYDDAVDLLAEMPGEQRTRVLAAMDSDEADVMRRLLAYGEGTAGGLMTPEVIILGPTATVAEALAHIRDPEWLVSVAAQVFVVQPPLRGADGHLPRRGRLPAAPAGAAVDAAPAHACEDIDVVAPGRHGARGGRAAGRLQPARHPGVRRPQAPARRHHRRRRARPLAAGRLAAAAPPGGGSS